MKKIKILAVVFGTLCLLAGASWGTAAASSTYVGVSAGDSFEYSCTQTYSGEYYYKYTLDMTFTIDNVTGHTG